MDISRRNFLKIAGMAAAGAAVGACTAKPESESEAPSGEMTLRVNPSTGDSVSILGYGCMRLPTVNGGSAQNDNSEIDQETLNAHVDYAIAHGVNYFDTSPRYCRGLSEKAMGEALSRHPRDKWMIATKLSNFEPADKSPAASKAMFMQSLRDLKTDHIDYYLLHALGGGGIPNMRRRIIDNGMLEFCKQQRAKGTIRNLGFSYHGDVKVFNELMHMHDRGDVKWDFAQIQLNYINWHHPAEPDQGVTAKQLYDALHSRGIAVVVMEPLLGGTLAQVPVSIAAQMAQRRPDDSPAKWAFRFAALPGVLTVLSGMTYMENVKENIATYSPLEPLSADETKFLLEMADATMGFKTVPCTGCAYCMPCPYGVDIPGNFRHYNKCIKDDNIPQYTRTTDYARARRAFLAGYDLAVDRERAADHCIACGGCKPACPQSIDIPGELARIAQYTNKLRQEQV